MIRRNEMRECKQRHKQYMQAVRTNLAIVKASVHVF